MEGAPGFPGKLRAFVHRALYPGAKWSAGIIVVGGLLLALVFGWGLTETALGYAAYLLSAYALLLLVLSLVPLARLLREKALRLPPVRMYLQQEVLRARIALYGGVCVNLVYAAYRGALGDRVRIGLVRRDGGVLPRAVGGFGSLSPGAASAA